MSELDVRSFPLHGSRLIEASAGTGKTYTIALLYVRLVLGHGGENAFSRALMPPEILVVTFTDAATQELRERIRARLAEAAEAFAGNREVDADDPLALVLADYSADEHPACALKLQRAAEWMDQAAVSTIHSWCNRMLGEHAFDSGSLFSQQLVTDQSELLAAVVQDYWRQHFYPLQDPAHVLAVEQACKSPAALLEAITPLLKRPDAAIRYAGQPIEADFAALLADVSQRHALEQAARACWRKHVHAIESMLREIRPSLNGIRHDSAQPEKFDNLLARCREWSEGGDAPGKLDRFAAGQYRFNKGKEQEQPRHEAFDLLAELYAEQLSGTGPQTVSLAAFLQQHAAQWVAQRLQQQLQQRAELGYDDLLRRLDKSLCGESGEPLAAAICQRFPVALIDEFQDTDPLQYRIFDRIYRVATPRPDTALVLIGDPKQAIYAFRGADIHTYLQARAATAGRHYNLARNFRSTAGVVAAVNHLFVQAEQHPRAAFRFGTVDDNPLPFVEVAAKGRSEKLLLDGEPVHAMTFWQQVPQAGRACVNSGEYRHRMAAVAASEIVRWLVLAQENRAGFLGADNNFTPLRPRDIAILVRTGKEANAVRQALRQRDVASVYLSDRDSVFASREARDMVLWLRACAEPGNDRVLRAALATGSLSLPLSQLEAFNIDEQAWENEVMRFRTYREQWLGNGVLPMLRSLLADFQVAARLLREAGGERALTNLLHLAEWLQQASGRLDGEQALIRHLMEQIQHPTDEQILRLESDADLIRVVTIHKAKGLEYPLVLLPFACSWRDIDGKQKNVFYHEKTDDIVLEIGGKSLAADAYAKADDERLSEDMRLLYVALTRARHALWLGVAPLVVGSGKSPQLHKSAFGYLLAGDAEISAEQLQEKLDYFAAACPAVRVVSAPAPDDAIFAPAVLPPLGEARQLQDRQREAWWIASYSALRIGTVEERMAEPEDARQSTAVEEQSSRIEPVFIPSGSLVDMHGFPRGARPGVFLHGLLEWAALAGFGRAASDAVLREDAIARRCNRRDWEHWINPLDAWLGRLLATPLPLRDCTVSLSQLSVYQPELEFWFAASAVDASLLDNVVTRHTLDAAGRPPLLASRLNGMMKGFIDLVFEHNGQYYVIDWKSNWLGPDATAYTADAMRQAVLEHRYELQYALYILALHRQLKNRLPDYDYDRHIGGAAYVFLRGIDNPHTRGVHIEKPPRLLVEKLDAMFAGQLRAEVTT